MVIPGVGPVWLEDLPPAEFLPSTPAGERILRAAADLFYHRGITVVGVDRIAERAGVTKRTLYQRFGSKDGLVAAYLTRRAHRWQSGLLTALSESGAKDPASVVAVIFDHSRSWAQDHPRGCAFVNAWADIGASDSAAVGIIRAEKQWMADLWELAIGDTDRAGQVHLLHEGAQVSAALRSEPEVFDRAYAAALRLLA